MWRRAAQSTTLGILLHMVLMLAGCAPAVPRQIQRCLPTATGHGGRQLCQVSGGNRQLLERCQGGMGCEVALFNLGFVHAYPPSPYHEPSKALQYFDDLIKKYPQTPWAFEGWAWRALLTANLASEEKRRRLQADLRSKDATIRTLRTQLGRSREIDMEIDKKERELLR